MRVLIVGDVHGRHAALRALLRQAQVDYRIGAAIQVGDFGFQPDIMARAAAIHYPVPLHVIDGNHEDHAWLHRAERSGLTASWRTTANLIYQPRASLAVVGGCTVGFLGGALHVDRPQQHALLQRTPNHILRRQSNQAIALFNRARPDLIVTHSCPCRAGIGMFAQAEHAADVALHIHGAGFDAGPPDDCGESELAHLWAGLTYRPRAWVFGHFHRHHATTVAGVHFMSVDTDLGTPGHRLTLWDTVERKLLCCPVDPSAEPL
jgi:predicted phosphodiesterase